MKVDVLGVRVNRESMQITLEKIQQAIEQQEPLQVITANPELIYATQKDARLKQLINSAQIVTPDGVGVVWASKRLGSPVAERVTGIDLVEGIFPMANEKKWRVFFLGSQPGVAELAAQKIKENHSDIILGTDHGYFTPEEESRVIKEIEDFKPEILLVGLGAPRQEFWIFSHLDLATVMIGVGGSFDALAGVNKRAPKWIQNIKLEWFYRLLRQPSRLRRQLVLPRFVLAVNRYRKEEGRSRKAR